MEKPKGVSQEFWDIAHSSDVPALTKQLEAQLETQIRTRLIEAEDAAILAAISAPCSPHSLRMDQWGLSF